MSANKDQVPDIIRRMNVANAPTAIVTIQTAKELGLPYNSAEIRCSLRVRNYEGQREIVEVTKSLTQLGFGREGFIVLIFFQFGYFFSV